MNTSKCTRFAFFLLLGFLIANSIACRHRIPPLVIARPCNNPGPCPPDRPVEVCIDNCAIKAVEGDVCTVDVCASDARICDPDTHLVCVPDAPNAPLGHCQNLGYRAFLAQCTPGDSTVPCVSDAFCYDPQLAGGMPPADLPPLCLFFSLAEGDDCDSNYNNPKLRPCSPGLECSNKGICVRRCDDNGDCSCGPPYHFYYDGNLLQPAGSGCFPGDHTLVGGTGPSICEWCRKGGPGTHCGTLQCCDESLACGPSGYCGQANDSQCTDRKECLGFACVDGKCFTCTPAGSAPTSGKVSQCCNSAATLVNGVCTLPCTKKGNACKVTSKNGQQIYGECQNGTVKDCLPDGTPICEPSASKMETCNGKDDDCDGKKDNIGGSCEEIVMGCQGGFKAEGTYKCVGTTKDCVTQAGIDYCTACGQEVDGQTCGSCFGQTCNADCPPNQICRLQPDGRPQCFGVNIPKCWHPSQVGKDCGPSNCTP